MNFKNLEEKCLYYRGLTDYRLMPNSNVICMLDGRSFSKMVKNNFEKPFDDAFIFAMNETAKYVCENVQGAKIAYVQSDEISVLITDYDTTESDAFFGYRLCKMQSIIASLATAKFNQVMMAYNMSHKKWKAVKNNSNDEVSYIDIIPDITNSPLYQFDCKCWTVPSANDAYAWFLYRQIDCIRNSKQQAAQTYLSHKELLGKDADTQIEMLKEYKGIDWNDYDNGKKYGRLIYQDMKHMSKTLDNGQNIEFDRKVWDSHYAFPLTEEGNKERFLELVPILKER